MYIFHENLWYESSSDSINSDDLKICMMGTDDFLQLDQTHNLDKNIILRCLQRKAFTFDHHDSIDYIGVLFLDKNNLNVTGEKVCILKCPPLSRHEFLIDPNTYSSHYAAICLAR